MFPTFPALCSVCMFSIALQCLYVFMRFMKFACFLALRKVLLFPGWGVDGGSAVLGVGWGIFLQKWQGVRILKNSLLLGQEWSLFLSHEKYITITLYPVYHLYVAHFVVKQFSFCFVSSSLFMLLVHSRSTQTSSYQPFQSFEDWLLASRTARVACNKK